jgi:hypothetical protein
MNTRLLLTWIFLGGIFLPRLLVPDTFFIQDEQPWIDRSQLYTNSLWSGDFAGAVRYPLSNHPAIPLMTTIGPVMNFYRSLHGLEGTYGSWGLDDKREAAIWARYVWGIVCSLALYLLFLTVQHLTIFRERPWAAATAVVLLGLEPWIWGISRTVSVDVLMAIAVVGMIAAAGVAYESQSKRWVFWSGAWFGLAFVAKSPALIMAPLAFLLAGWVMPWNWQEIVRRMGLWLLGAYVAVVVIWPPFLWHPIERLLDVLARAELHSTVQEIYLWPGIHPPLFIFTLSAWATVGCVLYVIWRVKELKKQGRSLIAPDLFLIAGIWHGVVLLLLHGDHARKNLPVLAMLGFAGAIGWLLMLIDRKMKPWLLVACLILLQGIFVWPYFPHVISSYNILFPSQAGKRLLVDVGNGSRVLADYINSQDPKEIWSVPMDSLITPYLDGDVRSHLRGLPSAGDLDNLPAEVTKVVVSASVPARVGFDSEAAVLWEQVSRMTPEKVLSVRDVPMFFIYAR